MPLAEGERTFGRPEIYLALGLSALFLYNAASSVSHPERMGMSARERIATRRVSVALRRFAAAVLSFRTLSV